MNLNDENDSLVALGLMSGTSLDGVDAALLETDGHRIIRIGPARTYPYASEFRNKLKKAVEIAGASDQPSEDEALALELTQVHAKVVRHLLDSQSSSSCWARPDVIGFHGHTILHRPDLNITQQIGVPDILAETFDTPVVCDFRLKDIEDGGQGAPLAPVYHAALLKSVEKPVAVVNVGGIANVTWLGKEDDQIIAFDSGPGNGLMDAWIEMHTGERFDKDGQRAAIGMVDQKLLKMFLDHQYFQRPYPKSLDRSDFSLNLVKHLNVSDGVATLCAITAQSIVNALAICPEIPTKLYVTGGGRLNQTLMQQLSDRSCYPVEKIESIGVSGDELEAQAFAFMAVRSLSGLPISFKNTTGVQRPMSGGRLVEP